MKRIVIGAFIFLVCGCLGPVELKRPIRDIMPGGQQGSSGGDSLEDEPVTMQKCIYVTGVEFDSGYDWRQASGYNDVGGLLFLMKDGQRILEIAVGEEYCVSSDADMHRCIGGHLYTDFSTSGETVIKKDGREILRYPGRETIAGMAVSGSDVYTLGLPRSGEGWTYRCNGEILLQKSSGRPVTVLHRTAGGIYFVYEEKMSSGCEYTIVENGEQTKIDLPSPDIKLDDARLVDGTLWVIAEWNLQRVLYGGSPPKTSTFQYADRILSGRFLSDGQDGLFVVGAIKLNGELQNWLWRQNVYLGKVEPPLTLIGGGAEWPGSFYVAGRAEIGAGSVVYADNKVVSLPDYDCLYGAASGIYGGSVYVGLVDRSDNNHPVLWNDGFVRSYDFNGYFTSISYW